MSCSGFSPPVPLFRGCGCGVPQLQQTSRGPGRDLRRAFVFFVLIKRPGWPVGTVVGVGSLGFLRGVYTLGSLGSGHSVRTPTGDLSEGLLFKQQLRAEMLGRNPWQVVNRGMFLRKNWFPVSERLAAPA